jgi:hypothetical protein
VFPRHGKWWIVESLLGDIKKKEPLSPTKRWQQRSQARLKADCGIRYIFRTLQRFHLGG